MTHWIIAKSQGFTNAGLLRISESVRTYAYLILSSQVSAKTRIVGNTRSSLTAQKAFLNNFENVMNRRVDIREEIKWYQNTLSYASSKTDYSVVLSIYMLPSDMNLNNRSGTVGNDIVNTTVPEKTNPILPKHAHKTSIVHAHKEVLSEHTSATMYEEEKSRWYSF